MNIDDLINESEPGLELVKDWIATGVNKVEILNCTPEKGKETLLALQVTTRSPMGAIAFETGGILVDHGWLRILGAGCNKLPRGLSDWNFIQGTAHQRLPGGLVVGDDVLGGFFAVNGGGLGQLGIGNVFYWAPERMKWEDMGEKYSQWLVWAFSGDLEEFYGDYRWEGWRTELKDFDHKNGFSFYPFLFTTTEKERSRKPVPMEELWKINLSQWN